MRWVGETEVGGGNNGNAVKRQGRKRGGKRGKRKGGKGKGGGEGGCGKAGRAPATFVTSPHGRRSRVDSSRHQMAPGSTPAGRTHCGAGWLPEGSRTAHPLSLARRPTGLVSLASRGRAACVSKRSQPLPPKSEAPSAGNHWPTAVLSRPQPSSAPWIQHMPSRHDSG